jgi:hypothetical protein
VKKIQFCIAMTTALWLTNVAHAEDKLDCATLKQSIETKLSTHGVKKFKLDIVESTQVGTAKVVGTCDGGAHKIVYSKDGAADVAQK